MEGIFDYMLWRGDLHFSRDGLNEIDALILSRAAYIPFEGIVGDELPGVITLGEAARRFLERPDAAAQVCMEADLRLARELAGCPRFAALPVGGYVDIIDADRVVQFAAMVFTLRPEEHFVAFRGTDNTLVGWKEDFNMTFISPVPSQLEAARYLQAAAERLHGTLIAGGHSKGGNLAVYSASVAAPSVRRRIREIYNNDGPGFGPGVMQTEGYAEISGRIQSFVPQSSVVGMLLEHEEDYTIIRSSQKSIMQHDLYSWEVSGPRFIRLDRVTNSSRIIDRALRDWLAGMTSSQRSELIDALFSLLKDTNAGTFRDLWESKLGTLVTVLRTAAALDEETRSRLFSEFGRLLSAMLESAGSTLSHRGGDGRPS